MMDPENLIFQGNYELKHGNAPRAIEFINHALALIVDLDPLLFWTPSGDRFSLLLFYYSYDFICRIKFGSNRKIRIFIEK